MKITGIKKAGSSKGNVILLTEPTMSEEVFYEFLNFQWDCKGCFEFDPPSLIWTSEKLPNSDIISQAQQYLTAAENKVEATRVRAKNTEEEFVKKAGQTSGLPLI